MKRTLLAGLTALMVLPSVALAQRPPSGNQGTQQMSLESAWAWLMARPGVIVAILLIVGLIAYMVLSGKKSKT